MNFMILNFNFYKITKFEKPLRTFQINYALKFLFSYFIFRIYDS